MALGDALGGQRRFEEAVLHREANDIYEKATTRPRIPWYRPYVRSSLGLALAGKGERAEAERLLIAGYEGLRDEPSTPPIQLRRSIERLVEFYESSGRRDDAATWRSRLPTVSREPALF